MSRPEWSSIVLTSLTDDDLELKKLFVSRYCKANGMAESALVERLVSDGELPKDTWSRWGSLADVDALISYSRDGLPVINSTGTNPHSPGSEHFRKPAAFERSASDVSPELVTRGPSGEVDASASEAPGLLKRLRNVKKSERSQRGLLTVDFRDELSRAEKCDRSLKAVKFSGLMDFAVLSSGHKADAIRKLAKAAEEGALEEAYLDNLGLGLACAESIALLLKCPQLRTLTLLGNTLNEAAVQRIARALRGHPGLRELSLGDQNGAPISVHAVVELLDAMETYGPLISPSPQSAPAPKGSAPQRAPAGAPCRPSPPPANAGARDATPLDVRLDAPCSLLAPPTPLLLGLASPPLHPILLPTPRRHAGCLRSSASAWARSTTKSCAAATCDLRRRTWRGSASSHRARAAGGAFLAGARPPAERRVPPPRRWHVSATSRRSWSRSRT